MYNLGLLSLTGGNFSGPHRCGSDTVLRRRSHRWAVSGTQQPPHVYALYMTTSEQRRPDLSAQAIAACGVILADQEGLESVSMRRIVDTLGVSAMALYRHIGNRESLLLAMAGQAARRSGLIPPPPASWQEILRHLATSMRESFVQHPWLLQIVLGPSRLLDLAPTAELEHLLGALQDAGLPKEECFDCVVGLSAVVIGTSTLAPRCQPGTRCAPPVPAQRRRTPEQRRRG